MEVNSSKPMERVIVPVVNQGSAVSTTSGSTTGAAAQSEVRSEAQKTDIRGENKKEPSMDELLPITKELNKFMTYLNADIQFSLHEKTQRLVVKVVDTKENKVLREFPPKELLDTIANIREYIGVLLDKKA